MDTLKRPLDATLSSSPAFGTPLHPIPAQRPPPPPPAFKPAIQTILPIILPPATLRPLAFRTFTKKHNLTLNASALQSLATFIGRHCGTGWREEGTGEKVLEEAARLWKAEGGAVIVEDGERLKGILKTLEGSMSGGKVGLVRKGSTAISRQSSFAFGNDSAVDLTKDGMRGMQRPSLGNEERTSSFGLSKLHVEDPADDEHDDDEASTDPRAWLKVISAFDQPRFTYDVEKKHFIPSPIKPSPFPPPSHKTAIFRERYNIIHQRLLRNEAFQAPSFSAALQKSRRDGGGAATNYKITPVANLLGRGGSSHLLLGQLIVAPTGTLALNDPSGSISISLEHATPFQGGTDENAQPYFCPGMIVLVDGVYEEDWAGAGSSGLGNTGGVGGTIGGRFIGFGIGGPPVEKRDASLGAGESGGGFGWTDFMGTGSDRAVGTRMRRLERRLLTAPEKEDRRKMVVMSEVTLNEPATLLALRKVLSLYTSSPPTTFLLMGNFLSAAALTGTRDTDSIAYKEAFNELAALLADFPSLLRHSTFVFVPGDNDPWASAFSAGASTLIPRDGVPELFTSRIKRAFANAKEAGDSSKGEAIWTSNPARLSLFGPAHEICVFRDDISGRFRRAVVRIGQATKKDSPLEPEEQQQPHTNLNPSDEDTDGDILMSGALPSSPPAPPSPPQPHLAPPVQPVQPQSDTEAYPLLLAKKTILTLLPQSTLSPFPLSLRPTHWDYTPSSLSLYPLPHTLVLADAEMEAYSLVFEGCCVLNPGRLVVDGGTNGRAGKGKRVGWCEYDSWTKRGRVRGEWVG
ncbi:DNA-directed DNA polymerase epsilon, subunit B [Saxophila tyrrhenica]|uniref:DNA polymerase epsilon subunit B n=1 Tax=Saxophila tyrrhenica TaxID=1690608 RepID=A0AAV9PAQ6_9PEZI|nr:DNA-directed DNA polymerase epsilon, subunit B [Saxophila tyrrhenica]